MRPRPQSSTVSVARRVAAFSIRIRISPVLRFTFCWRRFATRPVIIGEAMLVPDMSTTPRLASFGIQDLAELIAWPGMAQSMARWPGAAARSGPGDEKNASSST